MGTSAAVLCIALVLAVLAVPLAAEISCHYEPFNPSPSNDGYITSPGYPSPYLPRFCKFWYHRTTPGTQINIRFLDVDIPSYSDYYCSNDFLKIGRTSEHIYCGNIDRKVFEPYTAVTTASDYYIRIVFNSTSDATKGRGFQIYYQLYDAAITSTTKAYFTSESLETDRCHYVFTSQTGEITINRTVLECLSRTGTSKVTWLIYYPGFDGSNFRYEILFEQCGLPYQDKLEVYDGFSNTSNTLGIYTGSLCPNFLISTHSAILIEYLRGSSGDVPNLKLQFIMTQVKDNDYTVAPLTSFVSTDSPAYQYSDQCVFNIADHSGTISSDYLYSSIEKSGYCTWLLHVPVIEGQNVLYTLSVERLQLSSDSILNVYDGPDMSAPILGSHYSMSRYSRLKSTQSNIFIYFNPGIKVRSVGLSEVFTLKYSTDYACSVGYLPCGYGEFACYNKLNRCDNYWHCPLHGGDERECSAECLNNFSCGYRSGCYNESERCNGRGICPNNIDEQDCSEQLCSSQKGLYLCSNGHCIFEIKKCDKMDDCLDNSDEDGCTISLSPRVIVAAIASSLICALVLVIAVGCVCKVYRMHIRRLHLGSHHDTPLSRQLSEMLHRRAPPPPYHEAMLTSRPYTEPYLELSSPDEHQSESADVSNTSYQENVDPAPLRSDWQGNRRNNHYQQHQAVNENQHPSSGPESGRLIDVDTLPLFTERVDDVVQHEITADSDPPGYRQSLYSETNTLEDQFSHENNWLGGYENFAFNGDDNNHISSNGEPVIQMDMMSSNSVQSPTADQATLLSSYARNSDGMNLFPARHHGDSGDGDGSDQDGISASTNLSVDSIGTEVMEENKIQENLNVIDDDSDSDCILAENDADVDYDDSTDSDSAFILGRM